jgi:hypothetical protein
MLLSYAALSLEGEAVVRSGRIRAVLYCRWIVAG